MKKHGKWTEYKPTMDEVPEQVRDIYERIIWWQNEDGEDWYDYQKTLPLGVYAMRDDDGTILTVQNDVSKIVPARGELVQLEEFSPNTEDHGLVDSIQNTVMDEDENITFKDLPPEPIKAFDFLQRFTAEERKNIRKSGDEQVEDFFDLLRTAQEFMIDDPLVTQALDLLLQKKLITPARRAELAAEVPRTMPVRAPEPVPVPQGRRKARKPKPLPKSLYTPSPAQNIAAKMKATGRRQGKPETFEEFEKRMKVSDHRTPPPNDPPPMPPSLNPEAPAKKRAKARKK